VAKPGTYTMVAYVRVRGQLLGVKQQVEVPAPKK
jgi:hypothetical protein